MLISGKLEVFKNRNGYITAVFKAWEQEGHGVQGKAYMDANLPEDVQIKDGQTLTLDVKTAYLNAVHVDGENPFNKLKINVVDCEVKAVFPEKKAKKPSKKVAE